jgi:lipopolysaccharide transport system permease protein
MSQEMTSRLAGHANSPMSDRPAARDLPVTIYTPESSLRNPARMVRSMVRDLLASRELAWQLAVRDIRAQYRQTALGVAVILFTVMHPD